MFLPLNEQDSEKEQEHGTKEELFGIEEGHRKHQVFLEEEGQEHGPEEEQLLEIVWRVSILPTSKRYFSAAKTTLPSDTSALLVASDRRYCPNCEELVLLVLIRQNPPNPTP